MEFLILFISIIGILVSVQKLLCPGINNLAFALNWSNKTRGQITGIATSVPEAVTLMSTAIAGVWSAGLWNIASSNVINWLLLFSAIGFYRQHKDLFKIRFLDEIIFGALAVACPLVLMEFGMDQSPITIFALFGFFIIYRIVDRSINHIPVTEATADKSESIGKGILKIVASLCVIIVAGKYLGDSAEVIVVEFGMPAWSVGWLLGLVTSLPELTTFFMVYKNAKKNGELEGVEDTQEALDNLTSSNMSNVGLIYPAVLAVYLLMT